MAARDPAGANYQNAHADNFAAAVAVGRVLGAEPLAETKEPPAKAKEPPAEAIYPHAAADILVGDCSRSVSYAAAEVAHAIYLHADASIACADVVSRRGGAMRGLHGVNYLHVDSANLSARAAAPDALAVDVSAQVDYLPADACIVRARASRRVADVVQRPADGAVPAASPFRTPESIMSEPASPAAAPEATALLESDLVFTALYDPVRRALVRVLADGTAQSVNALADRLGRPPDCISKHLRVLRKARIIRAVNPPGTDGRKQYHELPTLFHSRDSAGKTILDFGAVLLRLE